MNEPQPKSEGRFPQLSASEAEQLAGHVARLAAAGQPLASGLKAAAGELGRGRFAAACRYLASRLERGQSLADAIGATRGRFPRALGSLLAAAERDGGLADALVDLVDHQVQARELRQSVWSALAYPALVAAFGLVITMLIALVIGPYVVLMLEEFEVQLSGSTRIGIWLLSDGLRAGAAVLVILVLMATGLRVFGGAAALAYVRSTLPLVGPIYQWPATSAWCRALAILVRRQTPLPDALRLASDLVSDAAVARGGRELAEGVERGEQLGELLRRSIWLPAFLQPIVDSGVRSGSLPEMLRLAAEVYDTRVRLYVAALRATLPPLVVLLVAAEVALVFGTIFMTLMELVRSLAGGTALF